MKWSKTAFWFVILNLFVLFCMVPKAVLAGTGENEKELSGSQEIEISKDTVKYDASEYLAPGTVSLKDLLVSLPGFEIDEDQNIFAYGQPVADIKVNGVSTLFESNNLLATSFVVGRIVKVLVYDDSSSEQDDSGIADMTAPQKEVDIIMSNELSDKPELGMQFTGGYGNDKFLYNASGAIIGYGNDWNYGIFAGAANNLQIEHETEDGIEGMLREYSAGVHYYTEKIKNFTLKLGAAYFSFHTVEDKTASRQSFFDSSRLYSESSDYCTLDRRRLGISAELCSDFGGKFYFEVTPEFYYTNIESQSLFNIHSFENQQLLNSSKIKGFLKSKEFAHSTNFYMTYRNFGKRERALLFTFNYFLDNKESDNKELSQIDYTLSSSADITNLLYEKSYNEIGYLAELKYVEPLGENWALNADISSRLVSTEIGEDAFSPSNIGTPFIPNFANRGDYSQFEESYSSYSDKRYFLNNARLLAQYRKGGTLLQFGGYGQVLNNEVYSRTAGLDETTGSGDYIWDWSPFVKFKFIGPRGRTVMANYIGSSSNLPAHLLMAMPDISDPSHITFGNIHLNPGFENNLNVYYSFNSKKKFNLMYLNFNISRTRRAVVDATWFDKEGVQYSVPVNSEKVTRNFSLEYNFSNIPIDRPHNLILNLSLSGSRGQYYGYQAKGESNVIDIQNFDYSAFMEKFWGQHKDGYDFYSGKTGFKRSKTIYTSLSFDLNFEYTAGNFTFTLGSSAVRTLLKYSFDERANMNTWVVDPYFVFEYETSYGLKFETDLDYEMYDGYSEAYGEPGLMWNFHASKKFNRFTISASVDDILDDASYLHRTVTDNYVEESVSRHLGRRIMLGISYDF